MVEQLSIIPMEPSEPKPEMVSVRVPKHLAGQVRAIARQLERDIPEPIPDMPAAIMLSLSNGPARGQYMVMADAETWIEADRLAEQCLAELPADFTLKDKKQFLVQLLEAVFLNEPTFKLSPQAKQLRALPKSQSAH